MELPIKDTRFDVEVAGVAMWCFTCDKWVDVEEFSHSDIKSGAILLHGDHDPSIFRKTVE